MFSTCASAGPTQMSLPLSSLRAHLLGYPSRLSKMWGCILASSYCSRKASTSKCQSMYITSTPRSVNLKIGISSLAGASHFLSLLPLWPLRLSRQPVVSLAVAYLSESGAPLTPPPTVVHWVLGGLPRGRSAPARSTGLASVLSQSQRFSHPAEVHSPPVGLMSQTLGPPQLVHYVRGSWPKF